MGKLSLALNFLGSLLPVVFPDKEFKPWRLFAVIDLTGDAMRLTTE